MIEMAWSSGLQAMEIANSEAHDSASLFIISLQHHAPARLFGRRLALYALDLRAKSS